MQEEKPLITRNQAIFFSHQSKHKKTKAKSRKNFIIKELIIIIVTFSIAYILANYPAYSKLAIYWINGPSPQVQITPIKPTTSPITQPPVIPTYSVAKTIMTIPKINVSVPIVWDINFDQIHSNLDNGVVHYVETAHPGEIGNVFIVGHSSDYVWSKGKYKNIFALLPKLSIGDNIYISYQGKEYIYQVYNSKITSPTAIDIIEPTPDAELTLMTCWPVGTSQKRYVVQTKLISPAPVGKQTTSPSILDLPKAR